MPKRRHEIIQLSRHKWQNQFVDQAKSHRIAAFIGGLQAGKTVAGADALAELLWVEDLQLPPQAADSTPEVWILSKTYSLAQTAWLSFTDRWSDMLMAKDERKSTGLHRGDANTHWLKPGPRKDKKPIRVKVRTVEDPENLRATQNLLVAWGDEAAFWKEEAWLNLLGRGIVTPTRYILTTTPRGRNWLYRDVYLPAEGGKDPAVSVITCRSIDNPWASKDYLEKLRIKFGEQYAAQELDALFVENAGMVYDFDRSIHMRKPPSLDPLYYNTVVFGVDPGYGDPYAVGVWARDHEGIWWLLEEFYGIKKTTDDLLPWFRIKVLQYKPKAIYVDKRRPSDYLLLRKQGWNAQANIEIYAETSKRTVMPMIRVCQQLLKTGKIFINTNCEWHAEEFEGYHFKDVSERNAGENPVDYKNHCMDSLRYAICSVEDLPANKLVRYRSGDDMMPRAGSRKSIWNGRLSATSHDYVNAIDKRMDQREKAESGRREREQVSV